MANRGSPGIDGINFAAIENGIGVDRYLAKLMATVAERIVDGAVLALIKQWLKAPVMGDSENGKTVCVGGGKGNSRGTLAVWGHIAVAIKHLPTPDGSYLATPRTGTETTSEVSAVR